MYLVFTFYVKYIVMNSTFLSYKVLENIRNIPYFISLVRKAVCNISLR